MRVIFDGKLSSKSPMNAPTIPEAGLTGRLYVPAKDIAGICEVSEYLLDRKYRPDTWAMPRDFRVTSDGRLLFALLSLPQLADSLQSVGLSDAALRLRQWAAPQVSEALSTLDAGKACSASAEEAQPVHSTALEEEACSASTPLASAARVEKSWLNRWEDERE